MSNGVRQADPFADGKGKGLAPESGDEQVDQILLQPGRHIEATAQGTGLVVRNAGGEEDGLSPLSAGVIEDLCEPGVGNRS